MTTTNELTFPLTDAVVDLTGNRGNAFALLGRVRSAIRKSNHPELADQFVLDATVGDYDHLLATCFVYVTVN